MEDKYLVILEVSNTDRDYMPLDGHVAIQVNAADRTVAISKAKREIYNMYGGNNEFVAVFKLTADITVDGSS
jgi:hypothetical protein